MADLVISIENGILEKQVADWFADIQQQVAAIPVKLDERIERLAIIRKRLYENLNQLQHKAWILKAARKLQVDYPQITHWKWHPAQTSHPDFADLTGYIGDEVFLNAELTTSARPIGSIATHMTSTLASLNGKSGLRFYFVLSEVMLRRAKHKIKTRQLEITPIMLPIA